jgi:hypothetical protein
MRKIGGLERLEGRLDGHGPARRGQVRGNVSNVLFLYSDHEAEFIAIDK